MATENNIKTFTAADIEKYHKGQLSPKQMNEMERAALEDPFLADAMEGFVVPGVNVVADIADLKRRLVAKAEDKVKVVPLYAEKRKPFMWWRVAAAVVLIGGAAVLASQFLTKESKPDDLAIVTEEKSTTTATDTNSNKSVASAPSTEGGTPDANGDISATPETKTTASGTKPDGDGVRDELDKTEDKEAVAAMREDTKPGKTTAPVVTTTKSSEVGKGESEEARKELAKTDDAKYKDAGIDRTDADRNKAIAAAPVKKIEDASAKNRNQVMPSIFRGRITDAGNTGVPFAKVYNPADNNAGTYTDANGYFTLTYPDSTLTVQVKAIGFENANTQLQSNRPSNKVIMQDDRSLSEVVVSRQMPNTANRSANNQMNRQLEEPEPADGWEKYDAYLANNLEAPEEIKTTERNMVGSVQVSFEVDRNGEPVNITVEKSLCPKCDKEAIRLIKEGPKWRRSANKHGRTTVTINF